MKFNYQREDNMNKNGPLESPEAFEQIVGEEFREILHGVEHNFHDNVGSDLTSTLTPDTSIEEIRLMVQSRLPDDMDFWITVVQELGSMRREAVVNLGPAVGHRGQEFEPSPSHRVRDCYALAYTIVHSHRGDDCYELMEVPDWMVHPMGPLHGDPEDLTERALEIAKLALVEDEDRLQTFRKESNNND